MTDLNEQLGIDLTDPIQRLAIDLVEGDYELLRRLIELRTEQGLSQAEVARRMGVTRRAVIAFERPDADPNLSTIRRYALAVGARVDHAVTHQAAKTRIEIDLNVRTHGNQSFTRLTNVDGPLYVGQPVEVYESESGIYGPAVVSRIDRRKRLVYLRVDWGALREPDESD